MPTFVLGDLTYHHHFNPMRLRPGGNPGYQNNRVYQERLDLVMRRREIYLKELASIASASMTADDVAQWIADHQSRGLTFDEQLDATHYLNLLRFEHQQRKFEQRHH